MTLFEVHQLTQLGKFAIFLEGKLRYETRLLAVSPDMYQVDASSVGDSGSTFRFYVQMKTGRPPLQVPQTALSSDGKQAPLRYAIISHSILS